MTLQLPDKCAALLDELNHVAQLKGNDAHNTALRDDVYEQLRGIAEEATTLRTTNYTGTLQRFEADVEATEM